MLMYVVGLWSMAIKRHYQEGKTYLTGSEKHENAQPIQSNYQ